MKKDKRNWVCPALCGCELSIVAEWSSELTSDGKMYQHPKGGTITDIQIVNVCADDNSLTKGIENDPYGGRPGYMKIPDNPTPAECLYINLYSCHGNTWTLSCGCTMYKSFDKNDSYPEEIIDHPVHTNKCEEHKAELDFTKAISDHDALSVVQAKDDEITQAKATLDSITNAQAILKANGIDYNG